MQDGEAWTNGHVEEPAIPPSDREPVPNAVAIEIAAVDEDAMDTTPDTETELVLADGSADPLEAAPTPSPPAAAAELGSNDQVPQVAPSDDVVSQDKKTY